MGINPVKRITLDGVLIALFLALGFLRIRVGTFLEIGFGTLVIVLAAVLLSPIDVLIIAGVGELLNQLFFSPYGITPTLPLWVLPVVVRGAIISLVAYLYRRKGDNLMKHKVIYFVTVLGAALVISCLDTGLLYLDGIIMNYPVSYTLLQTGMRFLTSQITGIVVSILVIFIYKSVYILFPNAKESE